MKVYLTVSYIHHMHVHTDNTVMWAILQNSAGWDHFKTPILQEILKIRNPLLEGHCAFLEVIHFFKEVAESEIISVDTQLRLDGLPAELWDLIVSVFGSVSQISDRTGQPVNDVNKHHNSQGKINVMMNIDSVPSNVQSSRQEALLYVFEDNEAVIKMIIKGRSPTMRHVSRTHRIALDWLFDRINLDSKIQIRYIDTKNQLADILTKGNFHA